MDRRAGIRVFYFQFQIFKDAPPGNLALQDNIHFFSLAFFFVVVDEI